MMKRIVALVVLLAATVLAACAGGVAQRTGAPTELPTAGATSTERTSESTATLPAEAPTTADGGAAPATAEVGDPTPTSADAAAPTATPRRNRRVDMAAITNYPKYVPFDGILPIYDPDFVPAAEAPFEDDELVLAIALEGEAKAYPITVLRSREMVNDELAGIPILATW